VCCVTCAQYLIVSLSAAVLGHLGHLDFTVQMESGKGQRGSARQFSLAGACGSNGILDREVGLRLTPYPGLCLS